MTQAVSIADALSALSPAGGRVVLMCGLAGSGKTTFSQALADKGFDRLGLDEEVWERFGRYGLDYPPEAYDANLAAARAGLIAKLDTRMRAGDAVVVDSAFWNRLHRDDFKTRIEAAGRPWALVYMKTPEAVLRSRLAVRSQRFDANAALPIDEATFGRFLASFQEPVDEGQITVIATDNPLAMRLRARGLSASPAMTLPAPRAAGYEPFVAYRLAIFDFDGTLADSYPWFTSVLDHMAARHKFRAIDAEERESLRGASARVIMKSLGVSTWKLARIAKDFRAMKKQASSGIPLFPGIPELLRELHAKGVVLALVSSDTEASVRIGLGPELSALFVHFDCGASLFGKARKFRRALRKLSMTKAQTICIGDEDRDARAADKAGIDFGAVTWGYSTPESLIAHHPKLTFDTVRDIAAIAG